MKKKIIITAVCLLLLALIGLCLRRCDDIAGTLLSQRQAQRFEGEREERFAQVSCFYPTGLEKSETDIETFRNTIDKKLAEAGVEAPEKGANWTDAYCSISSAQTSGERGSGAATAIGVGGDFFSFHPYELLSGGYISEDDVMSDRVVIDRELAWKLFGGTQLEGMSMELNGRRCYIAGVIAREDDEFSQRCFSDEPLVFYSFSDQSGDENAPGISCYELTMRDPISGFAVKTLTEGIAGEDAAVVENSERYSFTSIFRIFEDFGARSVQTKPVAYPYWENAARVSEVYIARLYVVIALLALLPLGCLLILLVRLIRRLVLKVRALKTKAKDAWEDRYGIKEELKEKRSARRSARKAAEAAGAKPRKKLLLRKRKATEPGIISSPERTSADVSDVVPDIESIVREVLGEKQS